MEQAAGIFCQHGPKHWQLRDKGALANLRLAVKDLFTLAGEKNAAGNPEWFRQGQVATETADSLTKLMGQGTRFVGFTHTDELAYSLEGNNFHYGAAENPTLPGHSCGGSSMGSAAAVAAGLADIGLGTDTGGSIRVPASYCGLYGIRPSHDAISSQGLLPLAPAFDTTGWLTTNTELLERVGQILLPKQPIYRVDQLVVCEPLFELVAPELADTLSNKLDEISPQFTQVVNLQLPEGLLARLADTFRVLQGREIARTHGAWLKTLTPHFEHYFAPAIAQRFAMALSLSESEEQQAKQIQQAWQQVMLQLSPTSALFLPTTPTIAPKLGADTSGLREKILTLTAIAGLSGAAQVHIPGISVPLSTDQPSSLAPYGYSLLMAANNDRSLLQLVNQLH